MRLDQYVLDKNPQLSRSYAARLINEEQVLVNGRSSKPGYRLRASDKVKINFDPKELEQIPDIDLPILHEDDDILVINKPTGVISHARSRYWDEPSVASFVRQITQQLGDRAGIVHRLDRATSGVMICAKNETTLRYLQKQFGARTVKKTYSAVIVGLIEPKEATIDLPIERNPKHPSSFRVGPNGKQAVTDYEAVKSNINYSLLKLQPKTGRTHQLRVHLAYLKHPIVGDQLYGGEPAERLYLHASSLTIVTPEGQTKTFMAPLPEAFNKKLKG